MLILGSKIDEPPKEEIVERFEKIPSVITNNHNSTDTIDPTFSDDESEPVVKSIVIEPEEDVAPTGYYFENKIRSANCSLSFY